MATQINVVLYRNFSKRRNSTKIPDAAPGVFQSSFLGAFIDETSVQNPKIRFNGTYPYYMCTYARIPKFNDRYYYIDDWTHTAEGWTATMHRDPMSTYRDEIGSSKQFILRNGVFKNGYIPDNMYPITNLVSVSETDATNSKGQDVSAWPEHSFNNGCYVVGFTGRGGQSQTATVGTQSFFAFTPKEFQNMLVSYFYDTSWIDGEAIVGVPRELVKLITNPADYICSCRWYPFSKSIISTVNCENQIKIGWWGLVTQTDLVDDPVCAGRTSDNRNIFFKVPKHPQYQNDNIRDYFLFSPYSEYTLTFPPFGDITLPDYIIKDCDELLCQTLVDVTTGMASLTIYGGYLNQTLLTTFYAKVGVSIPLSQSAAIEMDKAVSSGASVATAAFTGNVVGAVASAGIGAAKLMENPPNKIINESNGTFLNLNVVPRLKAVFHRTTEPNPQKFGIPYCNTNTIQSCVNAENKFIQTMNASVTLVKISGEQQSATIEEREEIERIMDGGFYYE